MVATAEVSIRERIMAGRWHGRLTAENAGDVGRAIHDLLDDRDYTSVFVMARGGSTPQVEVRVGQRLIKDHQWSPPTALTLTADGFILRDDKGIWSFAAHRPDSSLAAHFPRVAITRRDDTLRIEIADQSIDGTPVVSVFVVSAREGVEV